MLSRVDCSKLYLVLNTLHRSSDSSPARQCPAGAFQVRGLPAKQLALGLRQAEVPARRAPHGGGGGRSGNGRLPHCGCGGPHGNAPGLGHRPLVQGRDLTDSGRQERLAQELVVERTRAQSERTKLYTLDNEVHQRHAQLRERLASEREALDRQLAAAAAAPAWSDPCHTSSWAMAVATATATEGSRTQASSSAAAAALLPPRGTRRRGGKTPPSELGTWSGGAPAVRGTWPVPEHCGVLIARAGNESPAAGGAHLPGCNQKISRRASQ